MPELTYPEDLPVVARKDDIAAAIRDHQVVIVAGETGSGKTTQLPKICLEVGRGRTGLVGHTQPRRIAARSVAERIAEELGVELGGAIGYQVRFTDQSSDNTLVKVMTDGILLGEMQRDRMLRKYDTIIIDEAHERSLNIDFILGYLKQLLPRRPDLKVVITSATIDPERFAQHFADVRTGEPAPIIEVSGRTYPVEVRYRPLVDPDRPSDEERDQVTGVVEAVEELWTERPADGTGHDILVFLSGEREIRDTADALQGLGLPQTEVLPLYARLSAAEQHRVFGRATGRRIVLATNVAETSLTVPGIRYVVDAGTARISRYSQRTKVQRLPIEPISQASANQRAGRCGRLADGIAIRLYSQEDYDARPEFTEPEIQRTSLASVILQMTSLGLGDVAAFPFVDAPDPRQVADGVRLLEELGAFDTQEPGSPDPEVPGRVPDAAVTSRPTGEGSRPRGARRGGRRLTAYGTTLARLHVDPRLGRMLIEAGKLGCTREVLVIVAALSMQDPRERPADRQTQADQSHARFKDERSDFISLLNLWGYLKEQQKALSHSAFRRMCRSEFLHYLRVREWQDLHSQLRKACQDLGIDPRQATAAPGEAPDADIVHQAILSGLLSHIGLRDEAKRDYLGARGARFGISPGSTLFRHQPTWVMSAELVETTRLWARTNARIDPVWAERLAGHRVKRSYSEPRWSRKQGAVVATERVMLYGVPLVAARTVQYSRINPEESRDLFIRHALVEGDWDTHHEFWRANQALLRRLSELEERARRRDILVDDEDLVTFYDARLPADVVSQRHFDRWWKGARRETPQLLTFTEELLTRDTADAVSAQDYPRTWQQGGLDLAVTYQFEPGSAADGVTVHIPVQVLNQVQDEGFDWQVPGLREELATALLRSLPKATRVHFVPAPDHAALALAQAQPGGGRRLADELARVLHARTGITVPPEQFAPERVPDHLRVTFSVEDGAGRVVGAGKDLATLKEQLAGQVQQRMSRAGAAIERRDLTQWDFGQLPATFESASGGQTVQGYPALVDRGKAVDLVVMTGRREAEASTLLGVRRLLLINTSAPWKRVLARLSNAQKLALADNPHGSVPALLEDCLAAAVDDIVSERAGSVRDEDSFAEVLAAVRTHVATRVLTVVAEVEPVLTTARDVRAALDRLAAPATGALVADVRAQLDSLVYPGFVADTGVAHLPHLRRYLRAMLQRLDKASSSPASLARDATSQEVVDRVEIAYADLLDSLPRVERRSAPVRAVGWMVEELRVSLFANGIGTAYPVSEKRIRAAIAALD